MSFSSYFDAQSYKNIVKFVIIYNIDKERGWEYAKNLERID